MNYLGFFLESVLHPRQTADLKAASAEMVYGAPLTVPGDFILSPVSHPPADQHLRQLREISNNLTVPGDFILSPVSHPPADQHLRQLREISNNLTPVPTSHHGPVVEFTPQTLKHSPYGFLRRDDHNNPLQKPYTGPYRVIDRGDKTFVIDFGGREDRLKPAHIDPAAPVKLAQPPPRGCPPRC